MGNLERRIGALEAVPFVHGKPLAEWTDAELMTRILRLTFGREPTAAEVAEWDALPHEEFRSRLREMGVLDGNA